jgi:hypothetical protein
MKPDSSRRRLDCLIHLGAGRCAELDEHLAREPGRLILVEADRQLAKQLATRVSGLGNVEVLHEAVAAETGLRTYHRYNLPDANSLRPATGLRRLYPGLRLVEQVSITARGISALLNSLDLNPDKSNGLVIELAGEEAAVLESLDSDDRLHCFCEIELFAGCDALYEDARPAHQLHHWLSERGFRLEEDDREVGQDWLRWRLRRDDRVLTIEALRKQVQQLTATVEELQAQTKRSIQQRDQQVQLAEEREKQLVTVAGDRDALKESLVKLNLELAKAQQISNDKSEKVLDLEVKLKQITEQRDAEKRQVLALGLEIDRVTQAFDDASGRADQLSRRVAELETERTDLENRQDLLDEEMTRAEAQIELIKDVVLRDTGQ